jgi:lipoprotein-releasing system ATP-binding protein
VTVLQGVDLQVRAGETLAIVGASGSGKSTLLHLLGALDAPTAGSVHLHGQNLAQLSAAQQGELRNQHLGFVYQFHHLLPEFSALDNVAMPLRIRRLPLRGMHAPRGADAGPGGPGRARAAPPGGAVGRRAPARGHRACPGHPARPACWPTSPRATSTAATAEGVFQLMLQLAREQGTAFVMVTHDEQLAARCDRVLRLVAGRLDLAQ